MIIPYKVDVITDQRPIANYLIIICLVGLYVIAVNATERQVRPFILDDWSLSGLVGHMWLHANLPHIIGNLIFLWVFGNAVCAKLGNAFYLLIYMAGGLLAGAAHVVFAGGPAVGASGALYAVIGAYLVLYPFNSIRCLWLFIYIRRVSIAGFWIILWWVILNFLGAVTGYTGGTAYFAHIGGFVAGLVSAIILVAGKMVIRDSDNEAIVRALNV